MSPGFDLTAIVARIVAAIVIEAPNGPIFLAGYSMGGKIAYAVALALLAAGRASISWVSWIRISRRMTPSRDRECGSASSSPFAAAMVPNC